MVNHDTPKFYYAKGESDKAVQTLMMYTSEASEEEVLRVIHKSCNTKTIKISFKDAFCADTMYRRSSWIAMGITFFGAMHGLWVLESFANQIFEEINDMDQSFVSNRQGATALQFAILTGNFLALYTLYRFGRKTNLVFGFFACCVV